MRVLLLPVALGLMEPNRPVAKVVAILKEMEKELESGAEADALMSKKMECWCENTIKETEKSQQENNDCIAKETASIENNTGLKAKTKVIIANTENDIKEMRQSLEDETARRGKEQGEFQEKEKELVASIGGLKNAITVLKKHQALAQTGKSFLQVDASPDFGSAVATISRQFDAINKKRSDMFTPAQRQTLEMFLEQGTTDYNSQSGEIFGILTSMLDEFTDDLKKARDDEAAGNADFSKSKETKEKMIADNEALLKRKKAQFGQASQDLNASEESLDNCQTGLAKDTDMLAETKTTCQESSQEFAERAAARKIEQEAVAKALAFLDSDEAHEMFSKTFNFVQVSQQRRMKTEQAAGMLQKAAFDFGDDNLLALAQKVKAGAFVKVIRAIDNLVKEHKAQMEKDVEDKDACVKKINDKKAELAAVANKIKNGQAQVERLEEAISALEKQLEDLAAEIKDDKENLVVAGANRQEANAEYQKTVSEQTASVAILNKALQVLSEAFAFMQAPKPAGPAAYNKNAGGAKVLGMIKEIISDTEKEMALAIQEENNAQKAYEKVVRDTNDSIDAKQDEMDAKSAMKGKKEESLASTKDTLGFDTTAHKDIKTVLDATKEECKFLLDNFTLRQEHMTTEIEALNKAKAFLNGMTE